MPVSASKAARQAARAAKKGDKTDTKAAANGDVKADTDLEASNVSAEVEKLKIQEDKHGYVEGTSAYGMPSSHMDRSNQALTPAPPQYL